jgi:hypothetical protein
MRDKSLQLEPLFSYTQQHSATFRRYSEVRRRSFVAAMSIFRTMPVASKNGQKPRLNADFDDSADLKKRKKSLLGNQSAGWQSGWFVYRPSAMLFSF